MKLWIVGQYRSGEPPNVAWDFQGVFDSEARALAACRDGKYFIGPVTLNEELPHEIVDAREAGWHYPSEEPD